MKAKIIVPVLVLLGAAGGSAALVATRQPLQPAQPQPAPVAVRVVEVAPGQVRMTVHAQGTVAPRTESELVPEVSGNVVRISPDLVPGGYFEAGEPLLHIDDRDYRAELARAQASLSRAEAEHAHAAFEHARAEELHGRALLSQAELEAALRTERVAEATVREARAALETAERDLERTTLRAPFTGFVRSEQVDVGQFVSRGTAVATIYASDYVEVRLPIADRQLAYLNVPLDRRGELDEGTAPDVELTAVFAGSRQTWQGKLVRTEAEIDPASRMVYAITRVRADVDGATPPPVGLFVQAEIEGVAADHIVVLPRAALRDQDRVLVVDSENRLYFRDVRVLRVYREDVYVESGLAAGDRVVVSPIQTVVNGMRVQPLPTQGEGVEEG
ncbi:MAG: efflux RND transporter periplasmic adaptor subunit [Gammaproteobacteria bacterium]|nr:efflux RND transporter periplasmic adaptor subunit [Gammaproteobacteria bacterium]